MCSMSTLSTLLSAQLYFFATGSSAIVQAATKQEIALCKAITDKAQRLDCFKSLKIKVQKTQGAKLGETPNVKTPAYPVEAPFPQPQETTKVQSTPSPAVAAPGRARKHRVD